MAERAAPFRGDAPGAACHGCAAMGRGFLPGPGSGGAGVAGGLPGAGYLGWRRVLTSKITAAASTAPRTMYCREMSTPMRFMPEVRLM